MSLSSGKLLRMNILSLKPAPGSSVPLSGPIRSDEGLTLEASASQIFHDGNSNFINSFDKTKFSSFTLTSKQHHGFFRKLKFVFCCMACTQKVRGLVRVTMGYGFSQ